jgi:nucleoporin NUP1
MFKPRRSSNLVLMTDNKRSSRLGRSDDSHDDKEKEKEVNATKPYAGEGGMRKLLARRKLELEEEEEENIHDREDRVEADHDDPMDDDDVPRPHKKQTQTQEKPLAPTPVPQPPPPSQTTDWFAPSTATSASVSTNTSRQSSLRVGRTKTSRNHIARPKSKKFSAAFLDDDEGGDMDDSIERGLREDSEKENSKKELEEAAKHVPVFDIPKGFSFAKEVCMA